jgi:putative redox protein
MDERVEFESSTGATLSGKIDFPEGTQRGFALFAHCFSCGKTMRMSSVISEKLSAEGIALLRFDFAVIGQSRGEFGCKLYWDNVLDLMKAGEFLTENYQAPKLMIGHSLGGAAVLSAAHLLPSVKAVATIGAPFEPKHVRHLFQDAEFSADGYADIHLGGRKFSISKQFLSDLEEEDSARRIGSLGKALMIFHSPIDELVEVDNARQIYKAARHPKSFVSLDTADHLVTKPADAEFIGHVLSAWGERYLDN